MVQYIATTIWFVIFGIFVSLFHYPKINAYTHNTKLLRRTIGNYTTNHDVNINENAPHRHREHLLEKLKLKLNLPFDHTVSSTKVGRYDPLNPPQMASWLPFLFKLHPSHHKKPEQVHHNNSKNNVGNKTTDDTNMTENANADEISSITDDSYEYNVSNGNNGAIVLSNDYENFGVGDGDGTFNTTMKQDISPATINSRFFGGLMLAAASAITAFATAMFGLKSRSVSHPLIGSIKRRFNANARKNKNGIIMNHQVPEFVKVEVEPYKPPIV